jgi:hypothetical protein
MIELLLASQFFNLYAILISKYLSNKHDLPLLSEENSKELLRSLLDNGVYKVNDLKSMGIRNCDIIACKKERMKLKIKAKKHAHKTKNNVKMLRKLNENIENRNNMKVTTL